MPEYDDYSLIDNDPQNPRKPPVGLQGRPASSPPPPGYAGPSGAYGQGGAPPPAGGSSGYQPPGGYGPPPDEGGTGGFEPGDYDPEPRRRSWIMILAVIVGAFVFFAVGAAVVTLRDRLGGQEPTPVGTPVAQTTPFRSTPEWLATVVALATAGTPTSTLSIATPAPSVTPRPTITPPPTAQATPTPAPCQQPVAAIFSNLYRREVFGCPTTGSQVVWAAWEPFESGSMLWRSDDNRSYVFTLGGQWQVIDASWNGEATPSRGDVPPGRVQPERGFGWVWGTNDAIFNMLGWATDIEKGFCAEVQEFEQGFMLQSSSVPGCTAENLYNHASAGDWRTTLIAAHDSGVWSGALGGSTVVAPAPTRMITVDGRPEGNGVFQAVPAAAVQIDGNLGDWQGAWIPIDVPVEGSQNYGGSRDASGRFQVGWSAQGMQLAVEVFDDRFRPGPAGTDLWQGDALELHMDADLAGDFADTAANGDDYQLGIALSSDGRSLEVYRWLPLAQEGTQPSIGAGQLTQDGYVIEIVLPWGTFGLGGAASGQSFGFNLSISDNDSDSPAQESVISASPARTTYDNPTEWGTLVLMP